MSLNKRILLNITLMLVTVLAMVVTEVLVTTMKESDGLVINLSGRQRMLSQKMTKELLIFWDDFKNANTVNHELQDQVTVTADVFDTTLKALINGGQAPLLPTRGAPTAEVPPAAGEALKQLQKVQDIWEDFRTQVFAVRDKQDKAAMKYVLDMNTKLLGAMNEGVLLLQKQSEQKTTVVLEVQLGGLVVFLIVSVLTYMSIRKHVIAPVATIRHYADKVASGDLTCTFEEHYAAEFGALTKAICEMVENLKASLAEARIQDEALKAAAACDEAKADAEKNAAEVKTLLSSLASWYGKPNPLPSPYSTGLPNCSTCSLRPPMVWRCSARVLRKPSHPLEP